MQLLEKLPSRFLTPRGWGLASTGVVSLLFAQFLGRRDLLYLGILLIILPLVSVLVLRMMKPRFTVGRSFSAQTVQTGSTTVVKLSVRSSGSVSGSVLMQERLPARFGDAPGFHFPARHPTTSGVSLYEYRLRSAARGVYDVGPVTAGFTDPFGLGRSQLTLGGTDLLVITPAAVELPATQLTGARGTDGNSATRRQANPSNDDVMTREYRHGDPMRRVHWAATARHNELMVRQEESVSTPEATLIMDQRQTSFGSGFLSAFGADRDTDGSGLLSSPTFEWAVTAAMSISAHLLERSYALRFIDVAGAPALHRSTSSSWPDDEEHQGQGGLHNIAEGLAALELVPDTAKRGTVVAHAKPETGRRRDPVGAADRLRIPFGDSMMDKLAALRNRGPLIAVLGALTMAEARELAPAAEFGSHSFAMLVSEHPRELQPAMEVLRSAGWHTVAVSPNATLESAWSYFDSPSGVTSSTARTVLKDAAGTGQRA